jgi:hypothetical protein
MESKQGNKEQKLWEFLLSLGHSNYSTQNKSKKIKFFIITILIQNLTSLIDLMVVF